MDFLETIMKNIHYFLFIHLGPEEWHHMKHFLKLDYKLAINIFSWTQMKDQMKSYLAKSSKFLLKTFYTGSFCHQINAHRLPTDPPEARLQLQPGSKCLLRITIIKILNHLAKLHPFKTNYEISFTQMIILTIKASSSSYR